MKINNRKEPNYKQFHMSNCSLDTILPHNVTGTWIEKLISRTLQIPNTPQTSKSH
jgi:hypothetical protein